MSKYLDSSIANIFDKLVVKSKYLAKIITFLISNKII